MPNCATTSSATPRTTTRARRSPTTREAASQLWRPTSRHRTRRRRPHRRAAQTESAVCAGHRQETRSRSHPQPSWKRTMAPGHRHPRPSAAWSQLRPWPKTRDQAQAPIERGIASGRTKRAARFSERFRRWRDLTVPEITSAECEAMAADSLGRASDAMMGHPIALQLRNLQTLIDRRVPCAPGSRRAVEGSRQEPRHRPSVRCT